MKIPGLQVLWTSQFHQQKWLTIAKWLEADKEM